MASVHEELLASRSNGILMPLAAMKTESDWGVGDFSSLNQWVRFLGGLGASIVQILPLQETAPRADLPVFRFKRFCHRPGIY